MKPLITVIMPVYNASKYMRESIESVIVQSYKNWNLILIDDGSTDESISIIEEYCKKDQRIRKILYGAHIFYTNFGLNGDIP